MAPLCEYCGEDVKKLNQQVIVMRKEIKNLRQTLETAVRSHRKHMTSILFAMTNVAQGRINDSHERPFPQSSARTEISAHISLEHGNIQTVPIGYISSCFSAKNGTPRQPTICRPSRATIRIQHSVFNNPEHALVGLEHFSHVWVIFLFHKNGHLSYKAKVKPPRLNGERVGIYSTRTPHRPNALGLTLAKVEKIIGDTIHLSGIDMIAGTPVLDLKPYISDYDSPQGRMGVDVEPYELEITQSEMAVLSLEKVTDASSFDKNVTSRGDTLLTEARVTKVTNVNSSPEIAHRDEAKADITNRNQVLFPAVSNTSVSPSVAKDLSAVLAEVEAYVNKPDFTLQNSEDKDMVLVSSKTEPPESTPVSPGPCYGEDAYSTIAAWIRTPPVGNLEVRFTPHAQRELEEFLPPQDSGSPENGGPRFKFLHGPEEAVAAIRGVLSADPRSVYRRSRCVDRLFFFTLDTADITCWFGQSFAEVLRVQPIGHP